MISQSYRVSIEYIETIVWAQFAFISSCIQKVKKEQNGMETKQFVKTKHKKTVVFRSLLATNWYVFNGIHANLGIQSKELLAIILSGKVFLFLFSCTLHSLSHSRFHSWYFHCIIDTSEYRMIFVHVLLQMYRFMQHHFIQRKITFNSKMCKKKNAFPHSVRIHILSLSLSRSLDIFLCVNYVYYFACNLQSSTFKCNAIFECVHDIRTMWMWRTYKKNTHA